MTHQPMTHDLPFGEGAGAPNPSITHVQPTPAHRETDPNVITPAIVPPMPPPTPLPPVTEGVRPY
jgi:hypothetical protein